MKKIADWNMSMGTASKLASVVVHAQEMFEEMDKASPDANAIAHDQEALKSVIYDSDVAAWIKRLGVLAPLKRSAR
jgi:hypothetical protein